jgi:hypothetical protein
MLDWDLLDEPPVAPPIQFPTGGRAPGPRSPLSQAPPQPTAVGSAPAQSGLVPPGVAPDVVDRARQMADDQLIRLLGVPPEDLRRIAAQAEIYLSTIRSYLDALGSGLELHIAGVGTVDVPTVLGVDPALL